MDPFLGQIMMFGGNFAPRGWALCHGQLLPIASYSALFSILGTTYGGDGRTTFQLPDLRGRVAISSGHSPPLTPHPLGSRGGVQSNTLSVNQMPSHNHTATVSGDVKLPINNSDDPDTDDPSGAYLSSQDDDAYNTTPTTGEDAGALTNSIGVTIGNNGGNAPVNNMPPFVAVNYIIALTGVFPSRN